MKKYLSWLLLLVLVMCIFYFFIPSTGNAVYGTLVNCTETGVSRQLINKNKWHLWWPGQIKNDADFTYQNCSYRIDKIVINGFKATIFSGTDSLKGFMQFIYYGNDSTKFQWSSADYNFSKQPIKRFEQYFRLKKMNSNAEHLLEDIKNYFGNNENVYGLKIELQKLTAASMISVKDTFSNYPCTNEIYTMVQSVKDYIKKAGGEEQTYPMLHVQKEGREYIAMVAIPTKTALPSRDKFLLKNTFLGAILMAEVKGGMSKVINGEEELSNYVSDHKKVSPAVPFQSLVTNRLLQPDTSKWVTRLYYPIF